MKNSHARPRPRPYGYVDGQGLLYDLVEGKAIAGGGLRQDLVAGGGRQHIQMAKAKAKAITYLEKGGGKPIAWTITWTIALVIMVLGKMETWL